MLRVRRATPADAPVLAELAAHAYARYVDGIGRPPAPMTADYAAAIRDHEVWLAEDGSAVVALLVLVPEDGFVLLENVAVRPDRQGEGIGTRLLRLAEGRATELGCQEVRLYTNEVMVENIDYYLRRGYRETHRAAVDGFRRVHLSKELGRASTRPASG